MVVKDHGKGLYKAGAAWHNRAIGAGSPASEGAMMIVSVELDMGGEWEGTPEAALAEWCAEWGVTGEVLVKVGPAGGAPIVRVSGELAAVWPMVVAYAGGDEDEASYLMS